MPLPLFPYVVFCLLQTTHSLCVNLSPVMHAFSHFKEEQMQLLSCAVVTYSVHERTYILKTYYLKEIHVVAHPMLKNNNTFTEKGLMKRFKQQLVLLGQKNWYM